MLWIYRDFVGLLRDSNYRVLYDVPENLVNWLVPGFYYRVHNCHNQIIYIDARFWDGMIHLVARLENFKIIEIVLSGDLDLFRKTIYKFMISKDPLKFVQKLVKKAKIVYLVSELEVRNL